MRHLWWEYALNILLEIDFGHALDLPEIWDVAWWKTMQDHCVCRGIKTRMVSWMISVLSL